MRKRIHWSYWFASLLCLAGMIVRWTVKDGRAGTEVLFYATPPGVLMGCALFCLFYDLMLRPCWRAGMWFLISMFLISHWVYHDWRKLPSPALSQTTVPTDAIQVLFWNVARDPCRESIVDYIRQVDADIVGLVEATGDVEEVREYFRSRLPEYDISVLGGAEFLLTKGTSGQTRAEQLDRGSSLRHLRVDLRGASYDCFVIDIYANVAWSRQPALQRLAEIVSEYADHPVIVMGDFNIPSDSLHLAPLRQNHCLVFEVAGKGYAPTWPMPVPVLQLDQIWVNRHITPLLCYHGLSTASDHRPVHATLQILPD